VVEAGHSQRKALALKVRQPLASVTAAVPMQLQYEAELSEVVSGELNIKKVLWEASDTITVKLDTVLTPELKAEGEARDLMRTIQKLRKEQGLQPGQPAQATLPSWPKEWQAEIEAKTSTQLVKGDIITLVA
jgi:hypothetical protein